MNVTLKEYGPSMQLWSMLGPLLVACIALAVVVRSGSGEWILPLIALSGTFICCRWGWLGFAGVSAVLLAAAGYQLYVKDFAEWLWIIVQTLSIISTFIAALIILANSRDGWDIFDARQSAMQSEVVKLRDQMQASQGVLEAERAAAASRLDDLQGRLAKGDEKIASYERLLALVREELSSGHERQEKLLKELSEARQHAGALEQRIAALQAKAVQSQRPSNESALSPLKEALEMREKELSDLQTQLKAAQEEERLYREQAEEYVMELVSLREESQKGEELIASLHDALQSNERKIDTQDRLIESLSIEKRRFEESVAALNGQIVSLRDENLRNVRLISAVQADLQGKERAIDSQNRLIESLSIEKLRFETIFTALNGQLSSLREENQKNVRLISAVQTDLQGKECAIDSQNKLIAVLDREKQSFQAALSELNHQLEAAQVQESERSRLVEILNNDIVDKQAKLDLVQAMLDQAKRLSEGREQQFLDEVEGLKRSESREKRRLEGLYLQLQAQFSDKSKILDETRRELFYVQERAAALQKDIEESQLYGNNAVEEHLYKLLAKLEREMGSLERRSHRETLALEEIITALVAN